jgi:hypothetical protein
VGSGALGDALALAAEFETGTLLGDSETSGTLLRIGAFGTGVIVR